MGGLASAVLCSEQFVDMTEWAADVEDIADGRRSWEIDKIVDAIVSRDCIYPS